MFVVTLTYTAPLTAVDEHLDAHRAWLSEAYAAGVFVASGRRVPRVGGVILATGERAALDALLQRDPFARANVATYDVVEFVVTTAAADLQRLCEL